MSNKINIHSIRWELNTSNLHSAQIWQDRVSNFSNYELPGIIEKSMQPYDKDNENIIIDKIELDINLVSTESELKESFTNVLNKYLCEQNVFLNQNRILSHESKRILSQKDELRDNLNVDLKDELTEDNYISKNNFLQQLRYYLLYGNLIWNADENLFEKEDFLLDQLLVMDKANLEKALSIIKNDNAAIRLINMFNERNLQKLINHFDSEQKLIPEFLSPLQELLYFAIPGFQSHRFKELLLYKILLKQLFTGVSFDLSRLAAKWWYDITHNSLLTLTETSNLKIYIENKIPVTFKEKTTNPNKEKDSEIIRDQVIKLIELLTASITKSDTQISVTGKSNVEEKEIKSDLKTNEDGIDKSFFIENAGIVLFYPFLKNLFKKKNFLTEENNFIDSYKQMQAARLLQFIAIGNTDFKEYHLVLNKVLCGYSLESPILSNIDTTFLIKEEADELLQAVIKNWSKIGNVSSDGFRGSFILRNGKLTIEENNFLLRVEKKGWDVLLEYLPYTINVIKLPWLEKVIYVEW